MQGAAYNKIGASTQFDGDQPQPDRADPHPGAVDQLEVHVAALAWPNVAACRALHPQLAGLEAEALVRHPRVVDAIRERLGAGAGTGASLSVKRVLLMAEPPSVDANEIADKGYVNQAATRARRAGLVEALFQVQPAAHVACAA